MYTYTTHMYMAEAGYVPLLLVEILLLKCIVCNVLCLIIYFWLLFQTVHPIVGHLNAGSLYFITNILKIAFFN